MDAPMIALMFDVKTSTIADIDAFIDALIADAARPCPVAPWWLEEVRQTNELRTKEGS